jgi:hypothetical protein
MIDRHHQTEAARRALREQLKYSTDPQWVREQLDEHQFSWPFIIVAWAIGFLAFYSVIMIVGGLYP